jgi:A/G-specific adenine glycosylase
MAEQGPPDHLSRSLLRWYDDHARALPWRRVGGRQEPYLVWLSEIMLQQTTVAAVKDYFIKFVSRWPDVAALAAANREDVMRAWAGLGYYARARNLHACARVVAACGGFPDTIEGLLELPGIGPYTAAAIGAIAFDLPVAAVDGNVERVVSRMFAIETPLPLSKPEIRVLAQALVPTARAGDFAQAMMDLGATICTPKSPACGICPWTDECAGRRAGIAATLPRKTPKKSILTRYGTVFWMQNGDRVMLRQRPDRGLLGGMMEIPSTNWSEKRSRGFGDAPVNAKWKKLRGMVEHTFTHFHLELTVMKAEVGGDLPEGCRWVVVDALAGEALPTVMRKVVGMVMVPYPILHRRS